VAAGWDRSSPGVVGRRFSLDLLVSSVMVMLVLLLLVVVVATVQNAPGGQREHRSCVGRFLEALDEVG
jgi:hypothetical protein